MTQSAGATKIAFENKSTESLAFPSATFVRAHRRKELICFNAFKWVLNYVMVTESWLNVARVMFSEVLCRYNG